MSLVLFNGRESAVNIALNGSIYGAMTLSIATLSITTISLRALSTKGL